MEERPLILCWKFSSNIDDRKGHLHTSKAVNASTLLQSSISSISV